MLAIASQIAVVALLVTATLWVVVKIIYEIKDHNKQNTEHLDAS